MRITIGIAELPVGSAGIIAGYNRVYGGYIGKLISKGLTPNTSFVVLSSGVAGTVQIMLQDKIVTLSKPEANALCIDLQEEDF